MDGKRQVVIAVVIEVGGREGDPVEAEGEWNGIDGGAEATCTVSEQHTDGCALVLSPGGRVARRKGERAAAIEAARPPRQRTRPDREADRGGEAQHPPVFQCFEARPPDRVMMLRAPRGTP